MPTHQIRLRRAWDILALESTDPSTRRIDLPFPPRLDVHLPKRAMLTRAFATPPLAPGKETLAIRFERVVGLRSLRLNDRSVPLRDPLPEDFEVAMDEPAARNRLVLEVDFGGIPADSNAHEGWGAISLVIRPAE